MNCYLSKDVQNKIKIKMVKQMDRNGEGGCWNWKGGTFSCSGRARFNIGISGSMLSSRLVYVLFKGHIGNMHVLHTCDNVLCVNPKHLWLGTAKDNSEDMMKKGRAATGDRNGSRLYPERLVRGKDHLNSKYPERTQGENNGRATLINKQVAEIRRRYIKGVGPYNKGNCQKLAQEFGVSGGIIRSIGLGRTWKHL